MEDKQNIKNIECTGCGCLFYPINFIFRIPTTDDKCPYCGGGRGMIIKTPIKRIRELQDKVEMLLGDMDTFSSNALERISNLQDEITILKKAQQ